MYGPTVVATVRVDSASEAIAAASPLSATTSGQSAARSPWPARVRSSLSSERPARAIRTPSGAAPER